MTTLLVGRSYQEALKFAKQAGIKNHRYAHSASAITAFRPDLILVLDSFWKRADFRPILSLVYRSVDRYGTIAMEVHYEKPLPAEPDQPQLPFVSITDLSSDQLRAVGATDHEVEQVDKLREAEAKIADELTQLGQEFEQEVVQPQIEAVAQDAEQKIEQIKTDLQGAVDAVENQVELIEAGQKANAEEDRVNAANEAEALENKGSGRDEKSEPKATKPKKKGRRTNEQRAYDDAVAALEAGDGSLAEVRTAREALKKRHPDDERLEENKPAANSELDDLFKD